MSRRRIETDNIFSAENDGWSESSMEAMWHNGVLTLTIDNPWAGDSESGFGATCHFEMKRDKAREFGEWLLSLKEEK